jgi:hypothetical protein
MLILVLAVCVAAVAHRYLQVYAPSNAIVALVRREQPRLRVASGLFVLSTALATGAIFLAEWAANGGPGWLNLLVLIAIWDAFKFAFLALAIIVRRSLDELRRAGSRKRAQSWLALQRTGAAVGCPGGCPVDRRRHQVVQPPELR